MEKQKNLNIKYPILFLYIIFCVGIAGHLIQVTQIIMLFLTPITLLISGTVVLFFSLAEEKNKLLLWVVFTYLATFFLEAMGVATGAIFGFYKYGETLGLSFLNVPVIIGFNWVLVILGSIAISSLITNKSLLRSLITALLAVGFDYILEPIAIKLDYWQWEQNVIPLKNYAAWFLIAFISSIIFFKVGVKFTPAISRHYFFIQLIFFIILTIFMV